MVRQKYGIAGVFIVFVVLLYAEPIFAVQQYTVQLINNLTPFDINNSGEVVGDPQDSTAYTTIWNSGTTTELMPPGLTEPYAPQVNNAGQIVGEGINSIGWWQGFEWDPATGYVNVTVPDGYIAGFASINNKGEIGGSIGSLTGTYTTAAVWTSPQNLTVLPSLGNDGAEVFRINDAGQAIGDSGDDPPYTDSPSNTAKYGSDHAVLWQNGQLVDLTPDDPWSWASGINNRGQVVGNLIFADMASGSAFEWDPIDGLTLLPGGASAETMSINDLGQIVGFISDPNGGIGLASLWDNGTLYDLNNLIPADSGWQLEQAYSINDLGQILGEGTFDGDEDQAFLLTPVPEPVGIFMVTMMGFWCSSLRRR